MNKIAIIDMGTNTFHLLLAALRKGRSYEIFLREQEVVKIGKGGINEGFITDDACRRAIDAMKKFQRIIDEHGVSKTYAYGTSALRNAVNGPVLAEEIRSVTGITVTIISGDEEAQLIFNGIQAALDLGKKTSLVMDIGAGSVEFILCNSSEIFWKRSFEIGGQRLLEKYMRHDPIDPHEIAALDTSFQDSLSPLLSALKKYEPSILVGSSGTFDTLSEIFCVRKEIPYCHDSPETPLSIDGFYEIYKELIAKNRSERMNIQGMIEMRVDMIVVACCLVRFILERHNFHTIRVSTYSLKEGALSRLAGSAG